MTNTVTPPAGIPGNVIIQVSLADLRQVVAEMHEAEQQRAAQALAEQSERPTMTRAQVARELQVSLSTLWHWEKDGYLTPAKIGRKVLYRASDVKRILTLKHKEA